MSDLDTANVIGRYLQQKQEKWAAVIRPTHPSHVKIDQDLVKEYVLRHNQDALAKEFASDNAFIAQHICATVNNAQDRRWIQGAIAVGAYVLDAQAVDEAATVALDALQLACRTPRGRAAVPIFTLGAVAVFGTLLYLVTKNRQGPPRR